MYIKGLLLTYQLILTKTSDGISTQSGENKQKQRRAACGNQNVAMGMSCLM